MDDESADAKVGVLPCFSMSSKARSRERLELELAREGCCSAFRGRWKVFAGVCISGIRGGELLVWFEVVMWIVV
jgi:hypothetical protein